MKVLVVMDPISTVDVDKDTTFGFLLAAQDRQHSIWYCQQSDLYVGRDGRGAVRAQPLSVRQEAADFFTLGEAEDLALDHFETVWMRKDPPVDRAFLHATYVLDLTDALVLNRPSGLRDANEKFYALNFPEHTPETLVTRDAERIKRWLADRTEPLIVKPVDGHGGFGIFMLTPGDRNVGSILEVLTENGTRWVMVQAYLPAAREGDKRIILIDGEPYGAILRVPPADDHRGNIHVGATVQAVELSVADRAICAAVGPRVRKDGLYFVGIDVIGDKLTEVNVTSPTGIREIESLGGEAVGHRFVEWVEGKVDQYA
ncbi:MAG: glutathione synthase [Bradymonadia bacterium]|jgi:glutathione synthase